MDKERIEELNNLSNEELLDLYNSINNHIQYLNENIVSEAVKIEEENVEAVEESTEEKADNNG